MTETNTDSSGGPQPGSQPTSQPISEQGPLGASRPGLSPFCIHLDSKKLMLSSNPPQTAEDVLDASRHCWCSVTMKVLGPDDYECHPDDCTKSRGCFESPLADLL